MLKTWKKVVDSRSNRVSRVESKIKITRNKTLLIDYKQRDHSGLISLAGIENQEWRRNNRESRLNSRLDSPFLILARIENWVSTYFWTVQYVSLGWVGGMGFAVTGASDKVNFRLSLCWQAPEPGDFVLINSHFPRRNSSTHFTIPSWPGITWGDHPTCA